MAETVRRAAASWPVRPVIVTELADKHDAYAAAAAALTKSGTSTLELALAGVPMAVTYRVNPLTAAIARRLIRVPHVAMVNLLAGRAVVPELLQQDCRPAKLAETVETPARRPGSGGGAARRLPRGGGAPACAFGDTRGVGGAGGAEGAWVKEGQGSALDPPRGSGPLEPITF